MGFLVSRQCGTKHVGFGRALACLLVLWFIAVPAAFGQEEADSGVAYRVRQTNHGPVYIQDVRLGFSEGGGNLVRADAFAPARISLVNRTAEIFSGTIQIISQDYDGETVIHERAGIGIKPGGTSTIVMTCFVRGSNNSMVTVAGNVAVRLLDKDGKQVHSLEVVLEYVAANEHLILDISPRTIKGWVQLALREDPAEKLRYRGAARTAYLPPMELPTCWYDLEAVDVVVCDQPESARLSVEQWNGLAQWVRQGGLLVLGAGSMQSLAGTTLAKELPASAEMIATVTARDFRAEGVSAEAAGGSGRTGAPRAEGVGNSSLTFDWRKDMGVWRLKPRQDATVLLTLPLARGDWPIAVRRRLGEGAIVQAAVGLDLLLSPQAKEGSRPGMGTRVKPEIFGVRCLRVDEDTSFATGMSQGFPWPNNYGQAELIRGDADFREAGTWLALMLVLLTVVYGLVVTLGTWLVLRRRRLTQHSWLVFGVVAVAGSVGAGFVVQGARGIRAEVKQKSVVDLDAGTGMASVRTFYGLRVPYDARVDVDLTVQRMEELPPEQAKESYLRPASDLAGSSGGGFAVRRDYTIRSGQSGLKEVPIRATAKQFESYWYGPVGGTIQGMIVLNGAGASTGISPQSWVANQLGMDLRECFLVYSSAPTFSPSIRDAFVTVVRIGNLPDGTTRNDLAGLMGPNSGGFSLDKVGIEWIRRSPWNMMQGGYHGRQAEQAAVDRTDRTQGLTAAMVTLLSDLPTYKQEGYSYWAGSSNCMVPFLNLPRSGGRWLDLRNVLDGTSAILIGLADSDGPTRLKVDGKTVEPSAGECVVRAVIPLIGARQ